MTVVQAGHCFRQPRAAPQGNLTTANTRISLLILVLAVSVLGNTLVVVVPQFAVPGIIALAGLAALLVDDLCPEKCRVSIALLLGCAAVALSVVMWPEVPGFFSFYTQGAIGSLVLGLDAVVGVWALYVRRQVRSEARLLWVHGVPKSFNVEAAGREPGPAIAGEAGYDRVLRIARRRDWSDRDSGLRTSAIISARGWQSESGPSTVPSDVPEVLYRARCVVAEDLGWASGIAVVAGVVLLVALLGVLQSALLAMPNTSARRDGEAGNSCSEYGRLPDRTSERTSSEATLSATISATSFG